MKRRYPIAAVALAVGVLAAPASAHLTFFQSPAKNVHCVYLSTRGAPMVETPTVRCDTDFPTRFTRKPANCEFDFGGAFQVTARGHGRAICVSDSANSKTAARLKVGVERHFGPFTCKSAARNAMRCTSARGHGFLLSPTRQLVY
jgi:hypothetical protein